MSLKSRLFHGKQRAKESEELVFRGGAVSFKPHRKEKESELQAYLPALVSFKSLHRNQTQTLGTLKVPGVKCYYQ